MEIFGEAQRIIYRSKIDIRPSQKLQRRLKRDEVELRDGKWNTQQMGRYSTVILEWKVKRLRLWNNENEKIIEEIYPIRLVSIQLISLRQNKIKSIERLSRIMMPALEEINLNMNSIVCIKSISKCLWPKIRVISLSHNYVKEQFEVGKMLLSNLKSLSLQNSNNRKQWHNLSNMMKFETKILKQLYIQGRRIRIQKIKQKLKQKYMSVELKD